MRIACPHCTTSYTVDAAVFGHSGRLVRCARCKEQWLARPEQPAHADVTALAIVENSAISMDAADAGDRSDMIDVTPPETPIIDSPPIAGEWPNEASRGDAKSPEIIPTSSPRNQSLKSRRPRTKRSKPISLSMLCSAMGALTIALVVWRGDVVRLLPQTAAFYKAMGFEVNLRGLAFKDLKVTTETVEGKPVLVIEGAIAGQTAKTVEVPRLRFAIRDQRGQEIYAWNAILEQATIKPDEKAWFRSRLAEPPPEGRDIDVRFFNKRDLAGSGGKT